MPRVHLPDGRIVNFPDGMSAQDITAEVEKLTEPPKEERSLSGFLGNVANSGGRFLRDTATGLWDTAKFAADVMPGAPVGRQMARAGQLRTALTSAPQIASAAGSALKNRYGGVEQIKNTLYTDPVGVMADVSTVLQPAAWAAKAGGLAKTAAGLSKAANVTNPMTAIGGATQAATWPVARAVVRGTLRAPAAVRDDFGGGRGVADAVLKDRVYSEASAERKLQQSYRQADQMLADAEATGTPGVSANVMADALSGKPTQTANARVELGLDPGSAVTDRRARILAQHTTPERPGTGPTVTRTEAAPDSVDAAVRATNELGSERARMIPTSVLGGDNPAAVRAAQQLGPQANLVPRRLLGESQFPARETTIGGTAGTPAQVRDIPLTRAQTLKREAQGLAFEAKKNNQSLEQQINNTIARSLREGIEARAPAVGPVNERSQRLLGSKLAFQAAEDRPRALTNFLSILGGGAGFAGGGPVGALALPALMKAADSPRLGAMAGIGINEFGRGMNAKTLRAAVLARLVGDVPDE